MKEERGCSVVEDWVSSGHMSGKDQIREFIFSYIFLSFFHCRGWQFSLGNTNRVPVFHYFDHFLVPVPWRKLAHYCNTRVLDLVLDKFPDLIYAWHVSTWNSIFCNWITSFFLLPFWSNLVSSLLLLIYKYPFLYDKNLWVIKNIWFGLMKCWWNLIFY